MKIISKIWHIRFSNFFCNLNLPDGQYSRCDRSTKKQTMTIAKCEQKKKQYRWGGHYEAKYVCSAAAAVMLSPGSPINSHTTVGAED